MNYALKTTLLALALAAPASATTPTTAVSDHPTISEEFVEMVANDRVRKSFQLSKGELETGFTTKKRELFHDQHARLKLSVESKPNDSSVIIRMSYKFWNAKDFDGDNFVATASFHDAQGNQIAYKRVEKGLNGKITDNPFKAKTVKKNGTATLTMVAEEYAKVEHVVVVLGMHDTSNDPAPWEYVVAFYLELFGQEVTLFD